MSELWFIKLISGKYTNTFKTLAKMFPGALVKITEGKYKGHTVRIRTIKETVVVIDSANSSEYELLKTQIEFHSDFYKIPNKDFIKHNINHLQEFIIDKWCSMCIEQTFDACPPNRCREEPICKVFDLICLLFSIADEQLFYSKQIEFWKLY